jgi:PIG-P
MQCTSLSITVTVTPDQLSYQRAAAAYFQSGKHAAVKWGPASQNFEPEAIIMVVPVVTDKSRQDKNRERHNGPTSPASPLAQFPPLPPASSPSRAPEFYGFVAWAVTYLLFVLYFLWAILPDECIIWLGVSWYPNRYVLRSSSLLERYYVYR